MIIVKEYKYDYERTNANFYINERITYSALTKIVSDLLFFICGELTSDINCERDFISIKEQYIIQRNENSIGQLRPDLAKEWDKQKNDKITPSLVALGSKIKYYWLCPVCNHSYRATPKKRAYGTGCPVCASKVVQAGFNDLESVYFPRF